MKLHYITKTSMTIDIVSLGAKVAGLTKDGIQPSYITIDQSEFLQVSLSENKLVKYIGRLKTALIPGGKIYIEADPK